MGAVIFFLLILVALLLCTPRAERGFALGSTLLVGAIFWLAIEINLHRVLAGILGGVAGFFWEHRSEVILFLAAGIVLIVPVVMLYVAVCDQIAARAATKREGAFGRILPNGLPFLISDSKPAPWERAPRH
jgi:hypothetical protein